MGGGGGGGGSLINFRLLGFAGSTRYTDEVVSFFPSPLSAVVFIHVNHVCCFSSSLLCKVFFDM